MIIKNGFVFTDDKIFKKKDVYIENGIFVSDKSHVSDTTVIDADNLLVLPGLIDIHSHGAVGCDFSDADINNLEKILTYEYNHGITSYCPTSMSLEKEKLLNLMKNMGNWSNKKNQAKIIGINMEGPFLDISKKGAHRADCIIDPDIDFFSKCQKVSNGFIKLVTVSPSYDISVPFIEKFKNSTTISLGHTSADYDTSKKAILAGARHITHLFNAMNSLEHRSPGLIGAAMEQDDCYAELICDGIHVHESMIRAAFKLFSDRIVLISDSMRATGLDDGTYDLGGQQVNVNGKRATLLDGTIAGSVTNLYDCMKYTIQIGITPEDAIAAATMNPAKSIGIYNDVGSITPGKKADILLTDKDFHLLKVISF